VRGTAKTSPKGASVASCYWLRTLWAGRSWGCGGDGSVGGVSDRGEPMWQPVAMLAMVASLIDGGLSDAREQYETLLKARPKP